MKKNKATTESESRKQEKAMNRMRRQFRLRCHQMLDEYLSEQDPDRGIKRIDSFVGASLEGCYIAIGLVVTEPEEETDIEERAKASGIEIVKA